MSLISKASTADSILARDRSEEARSEAHLGLQTGDSDGDLRRMSATERTSSRIDGNPQVILGLGPQRPGHVLTFGEFGYRKDFFLLFPFWMFLIYKRGVLA
jgi:hypothetical protein